MDGLELFLPGFNLAICTLPLMIFPATIYVLQSNHPLALFWDSFLRSTCNFTLNTDRCGMMIWTVNIILASGTVVIASVNVAMLSFLVYLTVLYVNSITLWMDYLK